MADSPAKAPAGGIVGGLTSGVLLLLVIAAAAVIQYALRDRSLPLQALRRDLTRLAGRASPTTFAWLKVKTLEVTVPALESLDRIGHQQADLAQLFDSAMAILPLVTLRALLVLLALPLLGAALAWGAFEGLWARERIAAISAFPSAMGFALGKWCLAAGLLALALFISLPTDIDPKQLTLLVSSMLATGCYLTGRNLPLHF